MAEVTSLKKKRSAYKSVVNKLCKKLDGLLLEEEKVDDDDTYRGRLKEEIVAVNDVLLEKEAIIKDLDAKIIDGINDEEEFEKEIEQCSEYEITVKLVHEKVRSRNKVNKPFTKREDPVTETQSNVKLPKIELKRFS